MYTKGDLSSLAINGESSFKPLESSSSDAQKKTCILFAVSSYLPSIQLPVTSHEQFLDQLVDVALVSTCSHQVTALAQLHGSIINKWSDGK
jgi:hypothetical protein